jgi:prevent-host-death family protein
VSRIGLSEFNRHTSRITSRVREGEVIEVTDDGRPILRLVPIPFREGGSLRERLIAEGRLKPARHHGSGCARLGPIGGM